MEQHVLTTKLALVNALQPTGSIQKQTRILKGNLRLNDCELTIYWLVQLEISSHVTSEAGEEVGFDLQQQSFDVNNARVC